MNNMSIHLAGHFRNLLSGEITSKYITPLFWQHGETRDVLLNEIVQMHSVGVNGFIIESRPFPDFLGQTWWENVRFILDEARKRKLQVFIFDDSRFPSGYAAGRIRDRHPECLKLYLRENHLDAIGPLRGASFRLDTWLAQDERLVRVVAVRVDADGQNLDATTAIDITGRIGTGGLLFWDIPPGRWRIFLFVSTRRGGEEHTKDYLNPLEPEAVRAYLDEVYEPHFQHFGEYFGKTFAGFFSDEPRFGNAESYYATLGKLPMVVPFSDRLIGQLSEVWQGDFTLAMPFLWHSNGELAARARFTYMDVVSRLYADNFTKQIGDWCRCHKVKLIGHLVEDNGAHARLGYGAGHFFRAIQGQDWSGVDAVLLQLLPGYSSGEYPSSFGPLDSNFFFWGLTKLASSAGHLYPMKQGTTVCEAFGAYGWHEGLKLMKWLVDHFCVRGVNHFIPHAFSPKDFPDPDCPPHFYALGNNPQWRYIRVLFDYVNRLCHLLSHGQHVASAAVIYHAEAEWAGEYDPFEKTVKALAQRQIDCDIVPLDCLLDQERTTLTSNGLRINAENYPVLVVPYAQRLPGKVLERLADLADQGLKIIFMRDLPSDCVGAKEDFNVRLARLRSSPGVIITEYEKLAEHFFGWNLHDIAVTSMENDLRCYHYVHPNEDIYFFTNEGLSGIIDVQIIFRNSCRPLGYNPMNNTVYQPSFQKFNEVVKVDLCLEPYESTFIIFSRTHDEITEALPKLPLKRNMSPGPIINGPWRISLATAKEFPTFKRTSLISGLGNISRPDCLPFFSGTIRYETEFDWQSATNKERVFLDLGEVYEVAAVRLNGKAEEICIAPPYRMEISSTLRSGTNHLQIDVTNTLARQLGNNIFDRSIPLEPSGLIGPVQIWRLPF